MKPRLQFVALSTVALIAVLALFMGIGSARDLPTPSSALAVQEYDQLGKPAGVSGNGFYVRIENDGGNAIPVSGTITATVTSVSVNNDAGNAVPVSVASLPLPTGAAQDTTLTGGSTKVQVTNDAGNAVPVSVASLPLPSGAAQDTTLTGGNALVQVTNDAGNPVQGDPYAGDKLNTLVVQPVPAGANILIDAGTHCIRSLTFVNEGTVPGYAQVFGGQYTLDAGGTAAAATAPSFQIKCPAGTICSESLEAPLCLAGATWYSGVDAGFLLTTSAPVLTLQKAVIR
jgi:hypothetical protein